MKSLIMLFAMALLLTGCATKAPQVYTPNDTVSTKASSHKSDVGYAAGRAAGAAVLAGAYVITLPIRIVENIAK